MQTPVDALAEPLILNVQSNLGSQELSGYLSTNRMQYINGIKGLFHTIAMSSPLEAKEAEKIETSRAWIILYKRLISQLSFVLRLIISNQSTQNSLLMQLENTTFGDVPGLLSNLERAVKLQAPPPDMIARMHALHIGIRMALQKPVENTEVQFLHKLANMPTYCAEGLLGLLPLFSEEQRGIFLNKYIKFPFLSAREQQLLWPVLVFFMTPPHQQDLVDKLFNLTWDNEARITPLVHMIRLSPEFGFEFIEKALGAINMQHSDVRAPAQALVNLFAQRPDLLTESVILSLVNKVNDKESFANIFSNMRVSSRAILIDTIAELCRNRLDLLENLELCEQVINTLFSCLYDYEWLWHNENVLETAAQHALITLSEVYLTIIPGALLSFVQGKGEESDRLPHSALRAQAGFYTKHPELIVNEVIQTLLTRSVDSNRLIQFEAKKTLMALVKVKPELYDSDEIIKVLRLFQFLSIEDPELRAAAITVVMTRQRDLGWSFRLINAAINDTDVSVQSTAIEALGYIFAQNPDYIGVWSLISLWLDVTSLRNDRLEDKLFNLLATLCEMRPDLINDGTLRTLSHFLERPVVIRFLTMIFSKRPDLLNLAYLRRIMVKSNGDYLGSYPVVMENLLITIFENRPDLLGEWDIEWNIELYLLKRLYNTQNRFNDPFFNHTTFNASLLNRITSFFEKFPQLLLKPGTQEFLPAFHGKINGNERDSPFIMQVLMRDTPTRIVETPEIKPFFENEHQFAVQFDQLVNQLKVTTDRLIDKGSLDNPEYHVNYEQVRNHAVELIATLANARNLFFIDSCFMNPHPKAFIQFKNTCQEAIQKAGTEFIKHRSWWAEVPPILKILLGVLAAIPLGIPAMLVEKKSSGGYWGTFFQQSTPRAYKELQASNTQLGNLLNEVESSCRTMR